MLQVAGEYFIEKVSKCQKMHLRHPDDEAIKMLSDIFFDLHAQSVKAEEGVIVEPPKSMLKPPTENNPQEVIAYINMVGICAPIIENLFLKKSGKVKMEHEITSSRWYTLLPDWQLKTYVIELYR
ncbi:MAG: hypothetical protein KIG14_00955, partial [Candidatus Sacchiramonaceae bacterium]|nr:hypothetical protein [Candidatus Saccharimonadaceae bacterium]